jgi:hypothetical protein
MHGSMLSDIFAFHAPEIYNKHSPPPPISVGRSEILILTNLKQILTNKPVTGLKQRVLTKQKIMTAFHNIFKIELLI